MAKKGRKSIHDFSTLVPGGSLQLTGPAAQYPHQYIRAAKKRLPGCDFKIAREEGNKVFVLRTV